MPNADSAQAKQGEQDGADDGADEKVSISSAELSQIVNSAVTAQLKRVIAKELAPAVQAAMAPFKQELDALKPKEGDQQQAPTGKKSPELLALEKRLEDMQSALTKAEEEKSAERRKSREDRAFSELVTSLTGKVRPGSESMVAKLLRADGKLAIDDESGNATLTVRYAQHKGMPEDDHSLPIAAGVEQYLKTKDAQIFLPSPSNGGAGSEGRVSPTARQNGQVPKFDKPPANADEAAARTLAQFEALGLSADVLNSLG